MGDHDARKVGVIAEPAIEVLSIPSLKLRGKELTNSTNANKSIDDIELFAVSASDGLLDFMKPIDVAKHVASSLYLENSNQDGQSLLVHCENLVFNASGAWQDLGMNYRDDITIAVRKIFG